ncbi:MAG: NFACT RNA binding domain-containing protein, partial [Vulcanococcus sp.]
QRHQQLEQRLQQALRREEEQRQQQRQLLGQVELSDGLQRQADALLCLPQPGREQVAEAQALYRRARKLRRSVAAIEERLELHRQRIEQLEGSLTFLELCGEGDADPTAALAQLEALEQDSQELLLPRHRPRRGRPRPEGTPTPLELRSPNGLRLQVGRNHRQNDWISLRQARRGDLWFHAQECPGSHVVLKSSEGLAADSDLQAAADLAAHFSRARRNGRVAVLMVAADSLQRIPGAGPGTVRHRGGELLWADPQRAAALLAAAAPSLSGEPQP